MSWLRRTRLSLARKISLLFGTAVLLIIAVTLCFPWLQMTALNEQVLLVRAKRVASTALQAVDLLGPDWETAQAQLDERWPVLSRELGLPTDGPRLVRNGSRVGQGFQAAAMERLTRNREQRYYWRTQDDGRLFRFAMAIRGAATDIHATRVRGIIDVRLPVPSVTGAWNAVVTGLAGASGAMLAILVFYMVSQRIVLNPVRTLQEVAERVTTGDVLVRADIHTGDEFEDLSVAVNDMLTHINAAQTEQEKINRSLDTRLGELAETNIGLYESNRLKSEFLANVTHELRTPLVSIIGFAELLCDAVDRPEPDRKRIARYADNILTSGRSLLEIINDLLDLAKIEAGKLELHVTEFSIAALCEDLIDFVHPLADKRNQRLELQSASNLPTCRSDAGKIKQILYNLLSNAIKFTPTGGDVTLIVGRASEESIRLTVRDTGPGVPESQREAIFEKFRQLDSSRTREHEGTGLGLAITHDLVGVLGGTIALETAEGQGSAFSVDIPIVVRETVSQLRVRLP